MNSRIRIAHIITNFAIGGAQDYMLMIVKGLDKSKYETFVLCRMEGDWISIVKSLPEITCIDIPALRRKINIWNDIVAVYQIWKTCRRLKIDIVHTHSSKPGVLGRIGGYLAGVKGIVHTVHGFSFNDFMPAFQKKIFIAIEKCMSRFTSVLILYSKKNYETARKLKIGATRMTSLVYYGIDYAPFKEEVDRDKLRTQFGYGSDNYIIGFSGRLMEQKGLHILIDAFSIVYKSKKEVRLLLVGDGVLRTKLEEQINELGLNNFVVITGFRSDISKLLKIMDLFVMTSLWEGLSRSLAEAMYAKLPIIATDVGGTSDAIRNNETGWLIPAGNVFAATQAIIDAIDNPTKADEYAVNGYEWARKSFDMIKMNKKMESLYRSLIM